MSKTLIICPTRERATRCAIMLNSFLETRRGETEIICYIDDLDPQLNEYIALFDNLDRIASACRRNRIRYQFGPRLTLVEVCNKFSSEIAADYYGDVNDDHVYRTEGWDLRLIEAIVSGGGSGLAYGRTENLPGATLVSADCLRALGYYYPPCFRHQYVDNVQKDIYGRLGILFYAPEVWIEHRHPSFGKAKMDHTYQPMLDAESGDALAYKRWLETDFESAVERLRSTLFTRGAKRSS